MQHVTDLRLLKKNNKIVESAKQHLPENYFNNWYKSCDYERNKYLVQNIWVTFFIEFFKDTQINALWLRRIVPLIKIKQFRI